MPIQFLINGEQYEDPLNWDQFSIRLNRDRSLNAVILSYDINLILGTGAYKYLNDLRLTNKYCEPLKVLIKYHCGNGNWYDLVRGYIFLTECRFDLTECTVSTKVFDETFSSYIGNNRSVPFVTNAEFTKELVAMTPISPIRVTTFNPKTNFNTRQSWGYKVYDVFEKIIEFISNGKVKFSSNFFLNLIPSNVVPATSYGLILICGSALRSETVTPFTITFIQLYEALRSKYNLGMGFQLIDGIPHVIIEPNDYFLEESISTTIREANNITAYYDQQQLFNRIQFGSQTYTSQFDSVVDNNYLSFPDIAFRGFQDETFYVIGECNIDNILDCYNETPIIIDSNTIEDIVVYNNDSYDKVPVLIESIFGGGFGFALRTDPLGLGQEVYNGDLTNDNTANNFIGAVPNSIYTSYLGTPSSEFPFLAKRTDFPVVPIPCQPQLGITALPLTLVGIAGLLGVSEPVYLSNWNGQLPIASGYYFPFDNIIVDAGSNYFANPIFSYIIPATARIIFSSKVTLSRDPCATAGQILTVRQVLTVFDPARENVLLRINGLAVGYTALGTAATFELLSDVWPELILPTGCQICIDIQAVKLFDDECTVYLQNSNSASGFDTFFQIDEVQAIEGGELKEFNPDDYKRNAYNFKQPISFEQVKLLIENPFKQIKFTYGFQQLQTNKGFIDTVIISDFDKFDTEFTLISST
jgi:hypothetical protein